LADRAYVPGYQQASKRDMDQYRTSPCRPWLPSEAGVGPARGNEHAQLLRGECPLPLPLCGPGATAVHAPEVPGHSSDFLAQTPRRRAACARPLCYGRRTRPLDTIAPMAGPCTRRYTFAATDQGNPGGNAGGAKPRAYRPPGPGQPGRRLRGIRPRASGGAPPPASGVSSAQEDTRMRLARGTRDRTLSPVRLRALPAVRMQASLRADLDAAVPAVSSVDLHIVNTVPNCDDRFAGCRCWRPAR